MTAPRVCILTLGCKVNSYDSATIADRLRAAGCELVDERAPADVVIVNSCTVTDVADAERRQLARRARRRNPAARVILTGCYAQTKPTEAAAVEAIDIVVGLNRIDDLVASVTAPTLPAARILVDNSRHATTVRTFGARTFPGQTRAFLKVQEGCDLFCTFCIVPMARGKSRSLSPRAILAELDALADAGFEEVVLTGVHLGGYGTDLDPAVDLTWLVAALAEHSRVPRLRLSSIDPHEITEPLLRVMAQAPNICPHLHVPLQAADDGVLRRMRRRNDVAMARDRLAMMRDLLPDIFIGTDLITGFPGEDDTAFANTLRFLEANPVSAFHVFPYSIRSGTTAAKLDGHLPPAVIKARAKHLRDLGAAQHAAFARRFDGTAAEVLVESRDPRTGALRGYTRNYLRTQLPGPDAWIGRRVPVALRVSAAGEVAGEACL